MKDVIDEASDVYLATLDYMTECLEEFEPPVSPHTNQVADLTRVSYSGLSLSHLPHIRLPLFDGKFEDWESILSRPIHRAHTQQ